jgi:RNA polymerase sigma-70 factor (ECF subfamily)
MAHRRAVDRVRSSQASRARDEAAAATQGERDYDVVSERVETRLEVERVRHCLDGLTPRQRDTVQLAYYGGHSYANVATLLKLPLGTVKTRMRDGLIRLRDCLGVGTDA